MIRHRIRRRLLNLTIACVSLLVGIGIGASATTSERVLEPRIEVVTRTVEVPVKVPVEVERVITVEVERIVTVEVTVTPSLDAGLIASRNAVLRDIRARELAQLERIRALQQTQRAGAAR